LITISLLRASLLARGALRLSFSFSASLLFFFFLSDPHGARFPSFFSSHTVPPSFSPPSLIISVGVVERVSPFRLNDLVEGVRSLSSGPSLLRKKKRLAAPAYAPFSVPSLGKTVAVCPFNVQAHIIFSFAFLLLVSLRLLVAPFPLIPKYLSKSRNGT